MKTSFIYILLFFYVLHFLFPMLYILYTGEFTHTYSGIVDPATSIKAFLLNTAVVFGAIALIYFTPLSNITLYPIEESNVPKYIYQISIFYGLFFVFATGGFQTAISGENHGTFLNYLNLFFNSTTLLIFTLYLQKKKVNLVWCVLLFIVGSTAMGNRSAVLVVFLVIIYGFSFVRFNEYKGIILKGIKYLVIIGPILFGVSTKIRGADFFQWDELFKHLMERLNMIESSMIPIHFHDNNQFDSNLFYTKFNFIHQFKLALDNLYPGNLFEFDIYPNNYYRAIFLEYPIKFVEENYMSINLTLPVYFYMYFDYWAIPIAISVIVLLYYATIFFRNSPYIIILILSLLYEVLYFFDWVMILNRFYVAMLTLIVLKVSIKIQHQLAQVSQKSV